MTDAPREAPRIIKSRQALVHGVGLLLLLLLPLGSDTIFNSYYLDVATRIVIIWIALLGFDLLAGYAGLVSIGYAMFFGLGAYGAAWAMLYGPPSLVLFFAAGVATATITSIVVGFFCIRTRGVYFILTTLVFSELFYQLVLNGGKITGGLNGLASLPKAPITVGSLRIDWSDPFAAYYLAVAAFCASYIAARWIIASPFGSLLAAIRTNEDRAVYLGYDVAAIKRRAFTISAIFAGFAGAIWAHYQSYVSSELFNWTFSGQFLIMTWLGGVGTLFGPLIGGAFLIYFSDLLSSLVSNWLIFFGLLYIIVVLFAPQGLLGIFTSLLNRKWS